jgi:hypothetical protein
MRTVLLPGGARSTDLLEVYDDTKCPGHIDITCALTLDSVVECNAREFLHERLVACASTESRANSMRSCDNKCFAKSLAEAYHDLSLLQTSQMPTCIRIAACGHMFSAAPLLYEFVTRTFRCPLCRQGSAHNIVLEVTEPIPTNIDPNLWRVLCFLGRQVREHKYRGMPTPRNTLAVPPGSDPVPSDTMFIVVEIRTEHDPQGLAGVMRVVGRGVHLTSAQSHSVGNQSSISGEGH